VRVNEQGPFDFVVDTGSDATLIDTSLAVHLGLTSNGQQRLTTLTGSTWRPDTDWIPCNWTVRQ
jgi:hypothetical protein